MDFMRQQCICRNFLLTFLTNQGQFEAEKALGEVFLRTHNGAFATHIDPERPRKTIQIFFEKDKEKLKPYCKEILAATKLLRQKYSDEKFEKEVFGVKPPEVKLQIDEKQMVLL